MSKTIYNDGVLEIAVLTPRECWIKACEYDGIDPRSMFVVFSEGNPYA